MEYITIRTIQRKELQEIHIQSVPFPGESHQDFTSRTTSIITGNVKVVRATFFGRLEEKETTLGYFRQLIPDFEFPITWIEGDSCNGSFISGVYILAVNRTDVKRIFHNGLCLGSSIRTSKASYLYLGGLYSDPSLSPSAQTTLILESAEAVLNRAGMDFTNTVRTWYYLDDILSWYDDFNVSRTAFFNKHGIFEKLVPASTGISGKNIAGSKLGFELTSISHLSGEASASRVISPLQCSAEDYGSSFSRAVKYTDGEFENLTISGTASIDPEGKTVHTGDIKSQVKLSFEVVKAILDSLSFSFSDVVRSYAYVNKKEYSKAFYEYVDNELSLPFAFICAQNRICREGLMFEIELDLVRRV